MRFRVSSTRGSAIGINNSVGRENIKGDILLHITPPKDLSIIDEYFKLGVSKFACSIELWDTELAKKVTPGKIKFTTRQRHLDALEYIVKHYGIGKAFSNFVIGIEPFDSLKEGATYLAKRGIIPTASVWMPMGRPVNGTMHTIKKSKYCLLNYIKNMALSRQNAVDLTFVSSGIFGIIPKAKEKL